MYLLVYLNNDSTTNIILAKSKKICIVHSIAYSIGTEATPELLALSAMDMDVVFFSSVFSKNVQEDVQNIFVLCLLCLLEHWTDSSKK